MYKFLHFATPGNIYERNIISMAYVLSLKVPNQFLRNLPHVGFVRLTFFQMQNFITKILITRFPSH